MEKYFFVKFDNGNNRPPVNICLDRDNEGFTRGIAYTDTRLEPEVADLVNLVQYAADVLTTGSSVEREMQARQACLRMFGETPEHLRRHIHGAQ